MREVSRQTKVLYSSTKGKSNLLDTLQDNNEQYLERMLALKSFRTKSKKVTTTRTQQQDWLEEYNDLRKGVDKYEKLKVAQIEVFLCSGVDASSVTALIAEDDQLNEARSQLRNAYRQQVEQVKKFLSDQAKQMAKIWQVSSGEKGNTDSEKVDDNSEAHRQQTLITGVCADVLLQMRSKFDSSWQQLRQEEETLRREVALCQQSMHSMLREDDVQEQNDTLHREILSLLTQSTTSTRNSVDGNVGCGALGENDDASLCTARSTATQPKTVTARPLIPDDDPEFMALIGDITAQVHRIDNQLAQLQSAKQEEVKRLLLSLDKLPNTDSSAKTTAATSVPSNSASSNMYETLPEDETTIDRSHSTQMDNNVSVNEDQSAIQRSEPIETLTQSSVVEACTSPRLSSPTDAAVSPTKTVIPAALWSYGGWTASDHDLFAKIYRAAETKGTKRRKMLEQLTQQLCSSSSSSSSSTRTLEDILLHEEWYRAQRVITRKYKELIQTLHVQRQDCINQGQQQVQAYIKEFQEQSLRDRDLQQQEERRQQLHAHLERLREERLLAENERLRLLAASSAQEQLLLEEQLQQQQAERERKKSLVEAYKAQKKAMEIANETERQRQQQEAQAALQQLLEQNKSRVEFRAQQQEVKLQQRKLKEDEELNKEQRRLEFLNALAAQVPYYENIQNIESRLDHITTSAKAQEYVPIDEKDRKTRGHLPLLSFNDHTIVRDARFRLSEALARAGVQHSEAARLVVQQFNPRPHLAIHGLF